MPRFNSTPYEIRAGAFWSKVQFTDCCWLWMAGLRGGYGQFTVFRVSGQKTKLQAHRAAYEMCVGPIPTDKTVDHLCRTRNCVKPTHLQAVSNRENILRGLSPAAQRARVTHCPEGHEYTEANTRRSKRNQRSCRICHADGDRARYRRIHNPTMDGVVAGMDARNSPRSLSPTPPADPRMSCFPADVEPPAGGIGGRES